MNNITSHLPPTDPTTEERWGNALASRVIAYAKMYQEHGVVVIGDVRSDGTPHPFAG